MIREEGYLKLPFTGAMVGKSPDSLPVLPENLAYLARVIDIILEGGKPPLDPSGERDMAMISLLQKMEKEFLLHENWEQFVLLPGQDPHGKMANGVTSVGVMCSALNDNGILWQKQLHEAEIFNFKVLGYDLGMRIERGNFNIHEVAQSFILPEGDIDSLDQFLKVLLFNAQHPSSARTLVIDNRHGFWDVLMHMASDDVWDKLEVCFARSDEDAISFIKKNVDRDNLRVAPLEISHSFQFSDKNPVLILGTGNAKKIADARAIINQETPLLKMVDFLSTIGPFTEPPEKSITCVGNALEKMEAMLDVVYSRDGELLPHIATKYSGRPVVLIANDTAARIQFIDQDGVEVPLDFIHRPELSKSKDFIAEGKGRWWPGPEVKMVASAEGKSINFYTHKLPELIQGVSRDAGKPVIIEYTDESVYLYAVLQPSRRDIKYFATKGVQLDDMIFECDPSVGEADYETFTVPRHDNPEHKTRAQLGNYALLKESATLQGLKVFLQQVNFPEGVSCVCQFDRVNGRRMLASAKPHVVGTLAAFDKRTPSFGFLDFKQSAANAGFKTTPRKYDLTDLSGFEKYLSSVDAFILGGNEGLSLSPIKRAALISRIFVAIQTSHPSFAGKPLAFVKEGMDPVCKWFLETQDFLYNHKLYGRRAQDSFIVADNVQTAMKTSKKMVLGYEMPVINIPSSFYKGDDSFDRPTVSILGSASTYDPQHISMGQGIAQGCAERDLHFRHGGCSRGVVGGAADTFAAYRDLHSKGRMTGIQCHGLVSLEGMNEGNDCIKIHKSIGERKLDIYQSDIQVFGSGGWGTFEELFDMLALVEAGMIQPDTIIIMDYIFDACKEETTYQPIRQFIDEFLDPRKIQDMNIRFVKDDREALAIIDHRLPYLWQKYGMPSAQAEHTFKIA